METVKRKILIVDDDSFLLEMYAMKFNQNNFAVETATNGLDAIEKLKKGLSPDVILMDIIMPDLDGFEMLKKMQTESLAQNSVKIVLSNKSEQQDIENAKSFGVAGYIVKANSTPMEVIEQVVKILEKKEQEKK